MNIRISLGGAFAALIFSMQVVPAAAQPCSSTIAAQAIGHGNDVDIAARRCAQWGAAVTGNNHHLSGIVDGIGSRVATGSRGWRTVTRVDIRGAGNQFGSHLASGAKADVIMRGVDNGAAVRASHGTTVRLDIKGRGNTVRVTAAP